MMKKLLEIRAWRELYDVNMQSYLAAIVFFFVVTATAAPLYDTTIIWDALILIGLLALYLVFMFHFNDYCDMPFDIAAGKKRAIQDMPKSVTVGLLISFILLSVLLIAVLIAREGISKYSVFISVYALAYVLSAVYSGYPLKLKSRGLLGIIDNILIEKGLPVLLVFLFFNFYEPCIIAPLVFFSALELKLILDHQILDYDADIKTGVNSFVVKIGVEKATKLLKVVRYFTTIFFVLFVMTIVLNFYYLLPVVLLLLAGYFLIKKLVSEDKIERKSVRWDIKIPREWFYEIPLYDGYSLVCMNLISLFIVSLMTFKCHYFVFLLVPVVLSQYYLIKEVYLPTAKIFVSSVLQK